MGSTRRLSPGVPTLGLYWPARAPPVYQLLADRAGKNVSGPLRVPCYDTTLLIDDLHLPTDEEGAALIASEANFGFEHGHRAFKIKVGRGARHMPPLAGHRRDIAVIRAVRAAVGPDAVILIDANNGYTLNIAKHILSETADCNVHWLEEAFHEDDDCMKTCMPGSSARGWRSSSPTAKAQPHLTCSTTHKEGSSMSFNTTSSPTA